MKALNQLAGDCNFTEPYHRAFDPKIIFNILNTGAVENANRENPRSSSLLDYHRKHHTKAL
jgi:hypothetical protein